MAHNEFCFVIVAETKKSEVVEANTIFELRGNERVRWDFSKADNKTKKYVALMDDWLHRVFIYQTSDSRQELENLKSNPPPTLKRFTIPKRKSLGELKYDVNKFMLVEESTSSKSQEVNSKKAKVVVGENRNLKIIDIFGKSKGAKETVKTSTAKCAEGKAQKKRKMNDKDRKILVSSESDDSDSGNIVEVEKELTLKRSSTPILDDEPHPKLFKLEDLNYKKSQEDIIHNVEEENCASLHSRLTQIEEKWDKFFAQQEQRSLQICDMHQKVAELHSTLLSVPDVVKAEQKSSRKSVSASCKIKDLVYAIEDEQAASLIVPEDKVYIGRSRFVLKQDLVKVEKLTTLKARLQKLIEMVITAPRSCNLTGKDNKQKVEEKDLKVIEVLLNTLSWKKLTLREVKVGKNLLQPLSPEWVRRVIGKELSAWGEDNNADVVNTKHISHIESIVEGKETDIGDNKDSVNEEDGGADNGINFEADNVAIPIKEGLVDLNESDVSVVDI